MHSINESTNRYQQFGDQATVNGFRPGSSEWWKELRRLRDGDRAENTKLETGGIEINDDAGSKITAGMFVTAQLGNMCDMDWAPKAPMLLLFNNVSFFGAAQYTGLYKHKDGRHFIAQYVTQFEEGVQRVHRITTGLEIGIMYCTSSLPWDMEKMICEHLPEKENETIRTAMRFHKNKIAHLPATQHYVGDNPID